MKLRPEVQHLLERQAEWQRSRRSLSWPEKIRQAQQLLDSVRQLRRSKETADRAASFDSDRA